MTTSASHQAIAPDSFFWSLEAISRELRVPFSRKLLLHRREIDHLRQNLGRRNAHVMFVGYQANGTLGRRLVDGAREVRIFGEEIHVKAQRHTVGGLSAHTDQPGLLAWYGQVENRPPVVLVHGEDDAREALAGAMRAKFGNEVVLARPGLVREV